MLRLGRGRPGYGRARRGCRLAKRCSRVLSLLSCAESNYSKLQSSRSELSEPRERAGVLGHRRNKTLKNPENFTSGNSNWPPGWGLGGAAKSRRLLPHCFRRNGREPRLAPKCLI